PSAARTATGSTGENERESALLRQRRIEEQSVALTGLRGAGLASVNPRKEVMRRAQAPVRGRVHGRLARVRAVCHRRRASEGSTTRKTRLTTRSFRKPSEAPGRDGPPRRRPPPPRAARRGAARHARQPPCESQELSQSPPGSLLEACSGHLGSSERSASRRRHAGAAKGGQLVNRRTASAGRTPAAAGRGGGLVPPQPVTTKDTCGAESSSAVRPNRPSAAESPTGGGALPQLACSGACRSVVAFQA
ncbi:unnamed protein product, partial [Prorocentrum cordatum]